MSFSLDLTFSTDVVEETRENDEGYVAVESYDGNESVLSSIQDYQEVNGSILDQAFVEDDENEDESMDVDHPPSQNILEYSDDEESGIGSSIPTQFSDGVDISKALPKEETAAGIVANCTTSILMMSDEESRVSSFHQLSTANHVSFGVKLEKCLDTTQKENLERLLKAKMKSEVWMTEEVERSQAILRLYRLRNGEGDVTTAELVNVNGDMV